MKKKLLIALMAAALSITSMPMSFAGAKTTTTTTTIKESSDEEDAATGDLADDPDDELTGEFTKYDIRTTPAKKTIQAGKSFTISVIPEDDTEWEDLSDEEWDEICEENIDSITFRSTKSSVATVNKITGKVKAKKKGTAVIKATVALANGETAVYKTKVYVTR